MKRGRAPRYCRFAPIVALLIMLAAWPSLIATAEAEDWEALPANPKVDVSYIAPPAQRLDGVYQTMKGRRILEELQHFLAPLHLPHRLLLRAAQCDEINAFYSPTDRSLTLCYELVEDVMRAAPQTLSEDGFITRQAAIVGTVVGVVLHEGGHMIFDMLNVPVFGREEDAADEMASFIALQFNKDVERTIVKGYIYFFSQSKDPSASTRMRVYSDEHGTASQRMYNTLCLAYGGDPQTFQEFVDRGWLPKKRAERCAEEFGWLKVAFATTVWPFIDPELVARVQKAQWLTAEELK
jgi:hypothetical protein